jgi:hypothetical protein
VLEVMDWEMRENRSTDQFTNGNGKGQPSGGLTKPKKPGATKTLNKVLLSRERGDGARSLPI